MSGVTVTIIDADGLPKRVLFLQDEAQIEEQLAPGESHVVGHAPDGAAWQGGAWVPLPPDIQKLKAAKNAQINAARLAANRGSFTYQGKQIACDELSRSDIDGVNGLVTLTQALPPGWPGGWKTVDNDFVQINTVAQWAAFYGAMVAAGTANFNHAQALKAAVEAATTAAEVEGVQW